MEAGQRDPISRRGLCLAAVVAIVVLLPGCSAITDAIGGESCNMASTPMPVYAPVDMRLERVYYQLEFDGVDDWALTFRVSCEIWMILTHITEPIEPLRNTWIGGPGTATNQLRFLPGSEWVYVQAGDSLGFTYGTSLGRNWDFGVYDRNHRNDFINTARHDHHRGRNEFIRALNSVCPYDFFTPALRTQYEAKYGSILTNQPEPDAHCRQGSRDVLGTVAGTWWRVSGNPSFYGAQVGIAPEFGGHLILGGIGPGGYQTIVETDLRPDMVTTSHCWQGWDTWVYLRLVDDMTMHAAFGEGGCPTEFPSSGFAVYER